MAAPCWHKRPLSPCYHCCHAANLPEPVGALLGGLEKGTPEFDKAAKEAARTIPGREHGGNCDIKNLTKGCKVSCHSLTSVLYHLCMVPPGVMQHPTWKAASCIKRTQHNCYCFFKCHVVTGNGVVLCSANVHQVQMAKPSCLA